MSALLAVDALRAGETVVLEDISFAVEPGQVLAVLGRNGVGKSTLMETILGFTTVHAGTVSFEGTPIQQWPTFRRNRIGIGYVPQEREVFPSLSVEENLLVASRTGGWQAADVYELFPSLSQRRHSFGSTLSGGEQQMLAIARALMGGPKVLILDEPMEGLAPIVVEKLYESLVRLRDRSHIAMILIEQHAELALSISDQAIVLDRGRIVHRGSARSLLADGTLRDSLLGLAREVQNPSPGEQHDASHGTHAL